MSNGWTEWGNYVLKELERLDGCQKEHDGHLNDHDVDLAVLKVKAGVWGLMGGLIPILITLLIMWLGGYMKPPDTSPILKEIKALEKKVVDEHEEMQRQLDDQKKELDEQKNKYGKPKGG